MDGIIKGLMWPLYLAGGVTFTVLYWVSYVIWWPVNWGYEAVYGKKEPEGSHGSAKWADKKDLKKAGNLKPGGFPIGKIDGKMVYTHPENSVIMYGNPGEGKSLTMATSLLNPGGWHAIINDPAGKLHDQTKAALERKGYLVIKIDLNDLKNSARYNPLTYLDHSTPLSFDQDCKALAELVCPVKGSKDEHWALVGQLLVKAAISYMRSKPNYTLPQIANLLLGDIAWRNKMLAEIAKQGTLSERMAVNMFLGVSEKQRGGYIAHMFENLEMWGDKRAATLVDDPQRFTFEWMFKHSKPVALFISGGLSSKATSGAFARLVIGNAVNSSMRYFDQTGEPVPRGLKLFVDEAANLGMCRAIIDAHRELRKVHVRMFLAYVSRIDMLHIMGPEAEGLAGGTDIILPGGLKDTALLKDVSELIGTRTAITNSQSTHDRGSSQGASEFGRKLVSVDELMKLPKFKYVCLLGREPAMLDQAVTIKNGKPVL